MSGPLTKAELEEVMRRQTNRLTFLFVTIVFAGTIAGACILTI